MNDMQQIAESLKKIASNLRAFAAPGWSACTLKDWCTLSANRLDIIAEDLTAPAQTLTNSNNPTIKQSNNQTMKMKRTCKYCETEFVTYHKEQRYCSRECQRMAKRRWRFERDEQLAARMGVTLEELHRMRKSGAFSEKNKQKDFRLAKWLKPNPKTYAQIRAANRARKIEAGWRGQAVLGGGGCHTLRNDPPLTVHEMQYRPDDRRKL